MKKTLRFGQRVAVEWRMDSFVSFCGSAHFELGRDLVYKCASKCNGFICASLFSRIYTLANPKCSQYLYL